ncbi:MAG: multicopper oxidase family protein, partial [Proteobacteria bacterium]|nr:multicopper oxidase family protein [Pseudomonadota bacterium]
DKTQDLGLQGTYLVIAKDMGSSKTPDYSRVVVIDDLLMDKQGIYPFKDGIVTHALMGRYGNMFLVNNRSTDIQNVSKGDVWRYYFVNTANARPFKIAISGAKMKMIASDQGVFEREFFADDFVISPGERYIVDIMFDFIDGKKQASLSAIHPSGPTLLSKFKMSGMATKSEVSSSDFAKLRMNAEESKEFEPIKAKLSQPPLKHLTIDAELTGPHASHMMTKSHSDGIEWDDDMGPMSADITSADVKWFMKDEETKKLNMDINWKFNHNESVKIRIDNKGKTHPMQHPIHFHGQRFVVLARNGKPNDNLAWKDTALLPAGETMDIVLDNQNKGKWMAHCHISEHLAVGMMIGFEVK